MMIAHGPNMWWNLRKSRIWTIPNRKDHARNWFLTYRKVFEYASGTANSARCKPTATAPKKTMMGLNNKIKMYLAEIYIKITLTFQLQFFLQL